MADASDPFYGVDEQDETSVPTNELEDDAETAEEEIKAGVQVNTEEELSYAQSLLQGIDFE